MAGHKGTKAPDKTAEGLRRVGVVLYDTDPDQLACIVWGSNGRRPACAATGGTAQRLQPVGSRDINGPGVFPAGAVRRAQRY
jgi:hypothetical protein